MHACVSHEEHSAGRSLQAPAPNNRTDFRNRANRATGARNTRKTALQHVQEGETEKAVKHHGT